MGDINVIELVLLAIATFIFAIDQFSLTEVLYRPMVACPIMGAILGDINTGLVVGGTYELMMVGNMPIGGAQPPNAVLGGVVAMIFAVKADMDVNAALGACMIFATFGQYIVTLVFSVASGLMAKADKAAAEANPKGITNVLNIHMLMLGSLFAVIAIVAYVGGTAASDTLNSLSENASWFRGGLSAAGGMMRYVGFAILLKVMVSKEMWGFYFMGFGLATIFMAAPSLSGPALIILAFIRFAIAFWDYQIQAKFKLTTGTHSDFGGEEDGI